MGDLAGFIKNREKFASMPITVEFAHLYPSPPGGGLNEVIVRHFLKQLASALSFLRSKQLIHRDLKPQNLLLSPPNYSPQPEDEEELENTDKLVGIVNLPVLKIADFGFARELQVSSLAETLCGSPLYMAPEILRYEKYDAKADLWSLGTVLFEMIAGRPPFRASNHVELLRKIEEGNDRISFPSRCVASDGIKDLIYGLLKRSPVERMSFAQFFNHPAVQGDIPGAAGVLQGGLQEGAPGARGSPAHRDPLATQSPDQSPDRFVGHDGGYNFQRNYRESEQAPAPPAAPGPDPDFELPFARPSGIAHSPSSRPDLEQIHVTTSVARDQPIARPPISSTSAPAHHEVSTYRQGVPMQRHRSRNTNPSPSGSVVQQQQQQQQHRDAAEAREVRAYERRVEREQSDQDKDIMQEYVVIEKRSVEVNKFADELAASPRVGAPPSPSTTNATVVRRSSGQAPSRPSTADRPVSQPARGSERVYGASPGSAAASAIARALNLAPFRIWASHRYSPPPQITYPAYPALQPYPSNAVIVTGGKALTTLTEEDQAVVNALESCANKGDVVYHFAAVKYTQIIPMPTSPSQGPSMLPNPQTATGDNIDFDLPPEAVVMLSEQALVLYVKCVSLLNKAMQIAGKWWIKLSQDPHASYSRGLAAEKINGAVQWVRRRFNEAMEKAEQVRLKLKEAQSQLPPSHPSHPSNHTFNVEIDNRAGMVVEQDVFISPGVTAERLMFDRAIEMSRGAAVNELVGEDLEGCQMSYITALKLVEAVLETDDDDGNVDDDDRVYIENGTNCFPLKFSTDTNA